MSQVEEKTRIESLYEQSEKAKKISQKASALMSEVRGM